MINTITWKTHQGICFWCLWFFGPRYIEKLRKGCDFKHRCDFFWERGVIQASTFAGYEKRMILFDEITATADDSEIGFSADVVSEFTDTTKTKHFIS